MHSCALITTDLHQQQQGERRVQIRQTGKPELGAVAHTVDFDGVGLLVAVAVGTAESKGQRQQDVDQKRDQQCQPADAALAEQDLLGKDQPAEPVDLGLLVLGLFDQPLRLRDEYRELLFLLVAGLVSWINVRG